MKSNSINGLQSNGSKLALYQVKIMEKLLKALVDSSADGNFIAKCMVDTLQLPMIRGKDYKITFANGTMQKASEYVQIKIKVSHSKIMKTKSMVINIPNHDIILSK